MNMKNYDTYTLQLRTDAQKLRIASVCNNFCRLFKTDPFCIGKPVDDILDKKTVKQLYSAFQYLNRYNTPLTQLHEINGQFYIVKFIYKNPFIHIQASLTDLSDINRLYCKHLIHGINTTGYTDYILIEKQNGGFVITDISDNISSVTGLEKNCGLSSVFDYLFHLKSCNILDECLNSHSIINFIDSFENKNISKNIFITLIPLNHTKQQICIEINTISKNTFYNCQRICNAARLLNAISPKNAAAAMYSYSYPNDCFVISEKNDMFKDMLADYEEIRDLIDKFLANTVKLNRIIIKKLVIDTTVYTLALIPHTMFKRIFVFIFKNEDLYETYQFITDKLTNRETTVAQRLIKGMSIKCIADELGITEGTVKKTTSNIYKKLNIQSRTEFMQIFISYEYVRI